ncbi:MAG TPA: response regulator transcription factor [Thermotogota bacterium]|nr:response regulator transcription factor [Thermotogota bacterium]HRW35370.1 response regulator transcription factor [Thermotogota bacterium]
MADDDKKICDILKAQLERMNYAVEVFYNGTDLLETYKKTPCDLIITDIMMPGLSGYELCREIRALSDVPILMISAKDEEIDRVLGLELGSDDYISKPFSLRELSLKVRNILRRVNGTQKTSDSQISCLDLTINTDSREITVNSQILNTSNKEYELLHLFITNKNRAFSREQIIQSIWGYDYMGDNRQVDHLIKRLRKKLLLAEAQCKIETVWGFGYKVSDKD